MTYAPQRSALNELEQGMIDGTYKQVSPNRGGDIEPTTHDARRDLDDAWYGIHEALVKSLPDGLASVTPTYQATPEADLNRS
jgi:hypothetical protein